MSDLFAFAREIVLAHAEALKPAGQGAGPVKEAAGPAPCPVNVVSLDSRRKP